jgi:hypothetical protein
MQKYLHHFPHDELVGLFPGHSLAPVDALREHEDGASGGQPHFR